MTKRVLILGIIAILSAAFLFLPQDKLRRFMSLKENSRLWARIIGVMGLVWVFLAAATNTDLRLLELPYQTRVILDAIRYYAGGIIIGLFFALNTKKREGCQSSG